MTDTKNAVEELTTDQKVIEMMKALQSSGGTFKDNVVLTTIRKNDDDSNYWTVDGLPTKGLLYPDGTVLEARPMKVIEIKKLSSITETNAEGVVNDIIRRCVRGIPFNKIYLADKMFILFWLRANSFRDSKYCVDFGCPKCNTESKYHFEIGNVSVNYLGNDYDPNKNLPLSNGDEVNFRFLTIEDEVAISNFVERYAKAISVDDLDEDLLYISYMINTINGEHLDPISRYRYLLDVSSEDYATMTTYLSKYKVGIDPIMMVKCENCGGESPMGITFQPEFFLPKDRA